MSGDERGQLERYVVIGLCVQRRTYRIREDHQSWMNAAPEDRPFAVLTSMADFCSCRTEAEARKAAEALNYHALKHGTALRTDVTVVVP